QQKRSGSLWERLKGKKPESVRLAQSRRRYGLPDYTPHHALTDAIATAELLQAQIAHHYSEEQPIREFWL
ncbi:3'-5' exonuclease, partial [Escherichia coli]|nr:3'-5' exonuclease [Escherichia coli]